MKKKSKIILGVCIVAAVLVGISIWNAWFSATQIAFVNFQTIQQGSISKANDNSSIKLSEVSLDNLDSLTGYDMVFVNGMGLRIVEEQRQQIQQAADKGVPVYTSMATNPANNICNLDSVQQNLIRGYLSNGGKNNYRNMLNYIRKVIDGKASSVPEVEDPAERPSDMLYHAGLTNPDDELEFLTVADYEKFTKENNLYKEGAKKIMITGQMADATGLIEALEKEGYNVYPVQSMTRFMSFIDEIEPDAIINMAHGRMGDKMVDYLKEKNILLFAPLTINSLVDEWEKDPMGMAGGFMSQSIVTPEIDGAVRPFALFAQYEDEEGLRHSYAVPERLKTFVSTINNYLNLNTKPNNEKKVAIYYYKGPGQNALTAAGMEVVPSLYNLLVRMKQEGYNVSNLPANAEELGRMIHAQGAVFNTYAEGAFNDFMQNGHPELITKEQYESWVKESLRPEKYKEVVDAFGEFPGNYMVTPDGKLGIARLQFGNVVLLPQNAAGSGDNSFQVVHGTDMAPPHTYIASYLWMQHGFKADALIHFGTHGSLEFTPRKQVALCSNDWPDRLVGAVPHFYIYSIGNVGEGMMAKRRSYATLQSYLTPPFLESSVRGIYRELMEKIKIYNNSQKENKDQESLAVKTLTVKMGIHRDLGLDSIAGKPYSEDEIARVENFAEELATEKITGQLYTMGVPYEPERITSSVYAMATEPIAYSLLALDKQRGKATEAVNKHRSLFTQQYLSPARLLVEKLMVNPALATDELICRTAGITPQELAKARQIEADRNAPKGMMAMMMAAAAKKEHAKDGKSGNGHPGMATAMTGKGKSPHGKMPEGMKEAMKKMGADMDPKKAMEMAKSMGASPEALKKMEAGMKANKEKAEKPQGMTAMMTAMGQAPKEYNKEEVEFALAVSEVERTIKNVNNYKSALLTSPEKELGSLINALDGGYTAPTPGGDPIANPNALPTGRNMYAINAEATPTESAWEKGIALAKQTIETYKQRHNDSIPRKVSYTLWSSEFIETGGATIAQVLYMLGVEPVRDAFGRVSDLKLIPSAELGRPRIDVVVQTSGQLRDLAASRLFLINRAVEMAAAAKDDTYENQVAASVIEAERVLTEKGLSPKDAREISTFRVFGGANGSYGSGIQEMVEAGDRWENESEIAATYLNNMGAYYGNEKNWEVFQKFAFEAALTRTDVVVQPRQSNTWGALSLDHVYEFMGGMNLAVRNVTGKDPDAYLSDYRNRNNMKMQELKEAVGVESRTTILNPTYIKEKMKGGASSASEFAEVITNTYGWNVMKPAAIDKELWDNIYNVYVKDELNLGVKKYFEQQNPAALEEMTAVMLESVRKGLWKANEEQVAELSKLHTEIVNTYRPSCSGFVCDNAKLRDFIASKSNAQTAAQYKENISKIREAKTSGEDKGVVMKKEEMKQAAEQQTNTLSNVAVGIAVIIVILALILFVRKRRKNSQV
ncbi:cobaltochelatase subunit CobN [Bacteroides faecium]|uniref:Cobaltochelatase subunit CobN n=1 Tax=Bacteroides faecium TaxID=2715212 RepID=A0A6H0KVF5_9BACE|nr:cobaltochelatase subunit CobN [Bacteroides faecium]QIU96437.1 cobaltochelatase subunit CobN [Bacteroides faecium]